jgi:hypothetical protein
MPTDQETGDAVAYIKQKTAAPIERYFDSIVATRREERTISPDRNRAPRSKIGPAQLVKSAWVTGIQYVARLFRRNMPSPHRLDPPAGRRPGAGSRPPE